VFLTRFQINPHRRSASKLLASPQVMHAAVLASFPDAGPSAEGRVLWRLDRSGSKHLLIIASPIKPDLAHLVEQAGWPSLESGWEARDYRPLLNRISEEQQWAFRLTANPTHALAPEPGQKRGRVLAHRTVEHQTRWLNGQAERHGFALLDRQVEGLDRETGEPIQGFVPTTRVSRSEQLRFERGKQTVSLRVATFDGLLKVTDPTTFRAALSHGIGPARAYGCGLLTIAPPTSLFDASAEADTSD